MNSLLKIFLISLFFLIGGFSATAGEKEHVLSLDLDYALTGILNNGWGLGIYYDQQLSPVLSLKGGFGHMTFLDRHLNFTYTTVSVTADLNYYPFGHIFEGGYVGIGNGADFIEYVGKADDGEVRDGTVIFFLSHVGWKWRVSERFMVDFFTGYKFSPFSGKTLRYSADYLNMGMQYKIRWKLYL